jgi:hypothetical protein
MTSKEAAEFLGYSEKTLRDSRVTGKLGCVESPPYKKIGRFCIYEKADLANWLSQFKKITHTGQSSLD